MICRSRQTPTSSIPLAVDRRGTAMIIAIVCLLLVTTISFSLVKYAVGAHQQSERLGWRLQSTWLAESILVQTAARLRAGSDIEEQQWTTEPIGPAREVGRARISWNADSENEGVVTLTAVADFPDDPTDRVRTTRTLTLTLPDADPATTD